MKILLLKFRNIGDVLLITPLISNLKDHYPDAQIDIAVNKGTESMLTINPNINKLIIYSDSLSIFLQWLAWHTPLCSQVVKLQPEKFPLCNDLQKWF